MAAPLLVLTDFFQPANRALSYAAILAAALGTRLVLLHVQRDSLLDPELLTDELVHRNTEAVNLAFDSLVRGLPVPAEAEIGHGRVAEAVAAAVGHHHPVLLVLGRPITGDLPDELMTTTALELLRAAPCPMLVVPPTLRITQEAPKRVLLAVDGEDFSLGAYAAPMRQLLDKLTAELMVLHVEAQPGNTAATTAVALESVQRTGLTLNLAQPIRTRSIIAAHPAEGILKAATPAETDWVAMIARPRSFWSDLFHNSVTAQVLLHSAVPVLVLPAEE
jgi:nucleotide-binding universal stress UspA family protein